MGDDWGAIAYVIILAIAGLFALVRKAIEKATSGEKGKKVDLADEVQKQIRRYMREGEGGAGPATGLPPVATAPPPLPARPGPAAPPAPPRPHGADRPPQPPKRPVRKPRPTLQRPRLEQQRPAVVLPTRTGGRIHLDPSKVREAVVTAEILGPPLALRNDYRLF